MSNASVATVTTAFNAKGVLPRHLNALLNQERPVQEIVIVDNASTDGTAELLRSQYPACTLLQMKENLGAAGAWAAGLEYAVRKGHEWVWTFDDDSVPHRNALSQLLSGVSACGVAAIGMAAPLPRHNKSGLCYPPLLWRDGFHRPSPAQLEEPLWFADVVITSGALVSRNVVESVGLPRADFFMDWFDFEYCLRARRRGFKMLVVRDAYFSHEIGNSRKVKIGKQTRLWMDHPAWREYYMTRNLTYLGWWLYPNFRTKKWVLHHLAKHAGGVVLFGPNKMRCLARIAHGFADGLRANLGVGARPA